MGPFAVRVPLMLSLADFLGSLITFTITLPEGFVYYQLRLSGWICLLRSTYTTFNALFLLRAEVSLLRPRCTISFDSLGGFACPDLRLQPLTRYSVCARKFHFSVPAIAIIGSNGILSISAIGFALRLILRSRLTPGRLTLPGKP